MRLYLLVRDLWEPNLDNSDVIPDIPLPAPRPYIPSLLTLNVTPPTKKKTKKSSSNILALDCEMVGVIDYNLKNSRGRPKMVNALGRVVFTLNFGIIFHDIVWFIPL